MINKKCLAIKKDEEKQIICTLKIKSYYSGMCFYFVLL